MTSQYIMVQEGLLGGGGGKKKNSYTLNNLTEEAGQKKNKYETCYSYCI